MCVKIEPFLKDIQLKFYISMLLLLFYQNIVPFLDGWCIKPFAEMIMVREYDIPMEHSRNCIMSAFGCCFI